MKIPKSINYVILNYLSYFLTFLNSLLLGKYVGIEVFAAYGFILLFNQYLYYSSLGISYSTGTIIIAKKGNTCLSRIVLGNVIVVSLLLSICVVVLIFLLKEQLFYLFVKYKIEQFFLLLVINALLINFNNTFMQLYRVYTKYAVINFNQLSIPLTIFIVLLIKKQNINVVDIVGIYVAMTFISLLFYILYIPILPIFKIRKKILCNILKRGINLLLYNMSFAFIGITGATFVSVFYSSYDFAQYKFAQNISSATIMITAAFTFLFYPKMLNKFSNSNHECSSLFIKRYENIYVSAYNMISFTFCLLTPFIGTIFQKFTPMIPVYIFLIIGKIFSNQIGMKNIFIIAQKKEFALSNIGFVSIGIVVALSILFSVLRFSYIYIGLSIAIASFIYYYLSIKLFVSQIGQSGQVTMIRVLKNDFSYRLTLPIILLILSLFLNEYKYLPVLSFVVYCILNKSRIENVFLYLFKLIRNEKLLDF